ncbi:MAG: lipid-A-disaccharide synthase [Aureliella sp.]
MATTYAFNSARPSIFFSAGEPSGDLHASNLIKALRRQSDAYVYRGFGGNNIQDVGGYLDYELTQLAVVGFVEVVPKLREFFRVADRASDVFDHQPPEAVVLVDFPGFNWHIAKRAKERGIPVFYYLPPQLWAWGAWRIKKVRDYVDHVLCNLPFEKQWYAERNVDAEYVGHPFFDEVANRHLDQEFLMEFGEGAECNVAVLPGSRTREVKTIWPMQLQILRELANRFPRTRFHVACLRDSHRVQCVEKLTSSDRNLDLEFHVGRTSEVIEMADCSLMKSGSVSLEMMARGTPAVVVYQVSRPTYAIGRYLTDLQSMTLPNMIADKTIMPEFLAVGNNKTDTVERSIAAMSRLIGDRDERVQQKMALLDLNRRYGQTGASERAAEFIANTLAGSAGQSAAPRSSSRERLAA